MCINRVLVLILIYWAIFQLKTRYHLSNEQTDILDLQGWLDPEKMIANQTIIDFIFADVSKIVMSFFHKMLKL